MNFLAHAYLSQGDPQLLVGNMNGDFVKGKAAIADYAPQVQRGIWLHRFIDSYTDAHDAVNRAKILFRHTYHLYAGPIVDCIMDYYLANDPKFFEHEKALLDFTTHSYQQLEDQKEQQHPHLAEILPYMVRDNWLYKSRTLPGILMSLKGVARRAAHMAPPQEAYEIFVANYYHLNQCYFELMDDLVLAVKKHLTIPVG